MKRLGKFAKVDCVGMAYDVGHVINNGHLRRHKYVAGNSRQLVPYMTYHLFGKTIHVRGNHVSPRDSTRIAMSRIIPSTTKFEIYEMVLVVVALGWPRLAKEIEL